MQTQTHALLGAWLFGRRDSTLMMAGAIAGAAPDVPMFVIVAVLAAQGHSGQQIFGHDYFQPWWQHINGLSHSFPLWGLALMTMLFMQRTRPGARWAAIGVTVAAAGLAHGVVDFLCHREDAHMQFWPLSDWKFASPVSYYDRRHFGVPVMIGEAVLGLAMAWQLGHWARRRWSRALIAIVALPYAASLVVLAVSTVRAAMPSDGAARQAAAPYKLSG